MKKLLVLDVNGVLGIKEKRFIYYKGVKEFIDYSFLNYEVAFFSSMKEENLHKILINLLTTEQILRAKFIYGRAETEPDPDPINNWDTIKDIQKIRGRYPEYQVLACDDDIRKLRFNSTEDYVIVPKYTSNHFDNLKGLIEGKFK